MSKKAKRAAAKKPATKKPVSDETRRANDAEGRLAALRSNFRETEIDLNDQVKRLEKVAATAITAVDTLTEVGRDYEARLTELIRIRDLRLELAEETLNDAIATNKHLSRLVAAEHMLRATGVDIDELHSFMHEADDFDDFDDEAAAA